jgi:plastocyanin
MGMASMALVRLAVPAIVTLVVALATAPAVASSDATIHAQSGSVYSPSRPTIDQGTHVVLENQDSTQHNIVSDDYSPDGSRLFGSSTTNPGSSAPVAGTEYLTTGSYSFFCSIHQGMRGTLVVSSAGTPVPRPQTPDRIRPGLKLAVLTRSLDTSLLRRALLVHARSTEFVHVRVVARRHGRRIAIGRTVVRKAGFRGVRLRLTRFGRKLFLKRNRVTVSVRGLAVDRAGNRRRARARQTLFR